MTGKSRRKGFDRERRSWLKVSFDDLSPKRAPELILKKGVYAKKECGWFPLKNSKRTIDMVVNMGGTAG
jgi:hypothetical protein